MKGIIYLDNASTTFKKPNEVYDFMDEVNRTMSVNAHRGSYQLANDAGRIIDETRVKICKMANADVNESTVIFTPSATISLNMIINGLIREGDVVYVSPFEHNAVLRTVNLLRSRMKNITMIELPIDKETLMIDIDKMKEMFAAKKPSIVCAMGVSNVTGYILPLKEIFDEAKKYDAVTVTDGTQSYGLVDIDVKKTLVDFIVFAGHKTLCGPFGAAGFINVHGIELNEMIVGGTGSESLNLNMPREKHERYEAGSPNIVAIAGLYKALDVIDIPKIFEHEKKLSKMMIDGLSQIDGVNIYLPKDLDQHIAIVSISIVGYTAHEVEKMLDEKYNIAVRTGYHCAGLVHQYLHNEEYGGTVRISVGRYTTVEEVKAVVDAVSNIARLKEVIVFSNVEQAVND